MLFRAQRLFAGLRGIDPVRVDELIAVVMLVQIELHVWLGSSLQARVQTALAGVAASVAVAVRRRWPLAAVLAILALMAVQMALGGPRLGQEDPAAAIPALLLVFYGLGAYAPERRSTWALGLALVVISINQVTKSSAAPISNLLPTDIFGVLLPWAIGRRVRERVARERASRETAERLDAGRELHARKAAYGERARIARELHDVIAHSVSVMVIQAGGARMVMDSEPERAEISLRSVERAGREALAEMRRLLGVLDGEQDPRALAPQPGLADIEELLSRTRGSGLVADLRVDGEPATVTPAFDLCAYRIVQEALTNAIKHAAPARAVVVLHWRQDALELEISDDGRGLGAINGASGGHGIAGMRERAALHGGSIHAGAGAGGGFTVRARLPLARERVA
jgi:signal transduction histidine kinase